MYTSKTRITVTYSPFSANTCFMQCTCLSVWLVSSRDSPKIPQSWFCCPVGGIYTTRCWHPLRSSTSWTVLTFFTIMLCAVCVCVCVYAGVIKSWHGFRHRPWSVSIWWVFGIAPSVSGAHMANLTLKKHLLPPTHVHAHTCLVSPTRMAKLSTLALDKGYCCQMTSVKWLHVQNLLLRHVLNAGEGSTLLLDQES